jgi:lactate racemase
MALLHYGIHSSVEIELADGRQPDVPDVPRGSPVHDVAAAVAAALAEPLDYPPLVKCVTPADRVVLALDRGVPRVAEITAAAVDALIRAGVAPDGISVLQSPVEQNTKAQHDNENPCRLIAAPLRRRIELLTHDPADRRQLAYLAADESGGAILVHRALHEADVALPVGCLRAEGTAGYFGIHGAVYPTFSDVKTLERFRGPAVLRNYFSKGSVGQCDCCHDSTPRHYNGREGGRTVKRSHEIDPIAAANHVAWLLGVQFAIQVVPAAGEEVMHVVAGQCDAVRRQGAELYHAAWDWPAASPADLVVATVDGAAGRQTWENVGRALDAAVQFAEADGAIAVCCDLAARPGPATQHLSGAPSHEAALRRISRHRPPDAIVAAQLARALDRNKVYLLSRLEPSMVEELDMIPIENAGELARLVRHHKSCLLLPNAPYIAAVPDCQLAELERRKDNPRTI